MLSSFSTKDLEFVFTMANQSFSGTNSNRLSISGLRALVDYVAEGSSYSSVACKIFGLSIDVMNQLTTLQGDITAQYQNYLQIYTIDGIKKTLLFDGVIFSSWGSFENMPDVYLYVQASPYYIDRITYSLPLSYPEDTNIDVVMGNIAHKLGINYTNSGVSAVLSKGLYLHGSIVNQINKIADHVGFYWSTEPGALFIFPRNGSLPTEVKLISSETGMVGYPQFDNVTVTVQTLYQPQMFWGGRVNIQSELSRANGEKTIVGISHHLSSQMPNGPWFSNIRCNNVTLPTGQVS